MQITGSHSSTSTCESFIGGYAQALWELISVDVTSDSSGTITYEGFQNVFRENVGSDAIPFDFDWYVNHQFA